MTSFVVLHNDGAPLRFSERTEFVRDHFSIVALAFPLFWLLWHRLWFATVIFIGVMTILVFVAGDHRFILAVGPLNFLIGLFVALEGSAWRIASFKRHGYRQVAVLDAHNLEEAELKFTSVHATNGETSLVYKNAQAYETSRNTHGADDLIFGINGNK